MYTETALEGPPFIETSGAARIEQAGVEGRKPCCAVIATDCVLHPPPEPFHAVSDARLLSAFSARLAPPTPITFTEEEGYSTTPPVSPDDARNVTPVLRK